MSAILGTMTAYQRRVVDGLLPRPSLHRYTVTLQHDETGEHQGYSVRATSAGGAIAIATALAGGGRWRPTAVSNI